MFAIFHHGHPELVATLDDCLGWCTDHYSRLADALRDGVRIIPVPGNTCEAC